MEHIHKAELSDEDLDLLADKVSERLSMMQQEEFKKMKAYSFHNTRILLNNYQKLKAHVQNVEDQLEEDQGTFWNHQFLTLNALMQNKAKTVKIMRHVDDCLEQYKKLCIDSDSKGYDLLHMKYFTNLTDELIASRYGIDRTTVGRQIKKAVNELSIILYGADALDFK